MDESDAHRGGVFRNVMLRCQRIKDVKLCNRYLLTNRQLFISLHYMNGKANSNLELHEIFDQRCDSPTFLTNCDDTNVINNISLFIQYLNAFFPLLYTFLNKFSARPHT